MVDWNLAPNGDLFILEANKGVIVVRFEDSGKWSLVKRIEMKDKNPFAITTNNLLNKETGEYS